MGYKDPELQRAYQNHWIKQRRLDWLQEHGPCIDCGTWDSLEVDHVDPMQKVTHRVWSWKSERREAELVKCVARCTACHLEKTKHQTLRKRYCLRGHDTWKCGRDSESRCKLCMREVHYGRWNSKRNGKYSGQGAVTVSKTDGPLTGWISSILLSSLEDEAVGEQPPV